MKEKKLTIKKLYSSMTAEERKKNKRDSIIASAVTVACAVAVPFIPQNSWLALIEKYSWAQSVFIVAAFVLLIFAVYCFVGQFTVYKLREEWYENQLPSLRGNWHTFAAIEIQMVMFGLFTLFELFLLVTAFDVGTLVFAAVAALGLAAAIVVRIISYKEIKSLSEKPIGKAKPAEVSEEVEEFFD